MAELKFESASAALSHLYKQCGTWPETARFLGDIVTGAFLWKIVYKDAQSDLVYDTLAGMGYLEPRPHTVPVPVCSVCGQIHEMKQTCPDKMKPDPRRRRAWAGTEAQAKRLDETLSRMGYQSLREYIDKEIL